MRHGFSVDKHSDDESCDKAIEQLERVVQLGRQAQAALDAIRETGFYKGKAPVTGQPRRVYTEGHHGDGHEVRFAAFQQRVNISRADLPPLDELQLDYEPAKNNGSYGGHPCVEVPLYCKGAVAKQIDDFGKLIFKEDRQHLGKIRINKHHLSFVENSSGETVQVFQSSTSTKPDKYNASALVFAKRLARMIVNIGYPDDVFAPGNEVHMAAKTEDLQNAAPQWFVDDGVVARMYDEIHRYIRVMQVMES
jgi:hypothetical protein